MNHNRLVKSIVQNNCFFYGWVVTAVAALGVFFSGPGQTYFISIFIDSYIHDFGWSRSTISSLYSISTLSAGLLLFIVGRFADRYGAKKMTIIVALILGACCLWNSFISSLWMLFLGFFVGRLTGQGSMTLLPSTIVPQWFIKRRAFALSLKSIGGVIASAVIPPLNTLLIHAWGWQNTWRLWAALLWLFFIPIVYFFQYNRPEDIGLSPDNRLSNKDNDDDTSIFHSHFESDSWTLKEAFKTRAFWLILFTNQILPMITTGIVFHFISILGTKGLSPATASYVLSLMAIASFPTTLLAGYILDYIKVHYALAFTCLLQLLSLIILLNTSSTMGTIAFSIIQGIALGLNFVCNGVIWPNYFGMKHLGSIRGLSMTVLVIGTSFGPLPLGIGFDLFGRYTESIMFLMSFPIIGTIAAFVSPKPTKKFINKG